MKTTFTLLLATLVCFSNLQAKKITVKISNKTDQLITQLDYWVGSATEANSANLNFNSKGTMPSGVDINIPLDFHSSKRNTLLIRGYLTGGGYISQKYTISDGELAPIISLYNVAAKVKTSEFNSVMDKFSVLKITNGETQSSRENAMDALIGAIFVYSDDTYTNIIYKITPGVLRTRVKEIAQPNLNRKISGIFSSETSINGSLTLPFVSASTSFETGDISKFVWEIEDVGEYNWSSDEDKDLAELFINLPPQTKKTLIDLYEKYPNAKMKFIDKAFVIGRLQVTTHKSKKISTNIELNGANYVTANGNYMFIDDLKDEFILKDVITQIDGYDATILLTSLYLENKTQNLAILTNDENERIKSEYKYLRELYPDYLIETNDVNIMKRALAELANNPDIKLSFIKKTLKEEKIDIKTLN